MNSANEVAESPQELKSIKSRDERPGDSDKN